MKDIGRFYRTSDGSPPVIGNGSELLNNLRRVAPRTSFHVILEGKEEIAIRYSMREAVGAMRSLSDSIKFKPILTEYPHSAN